jgi:hypothetical protein
VAMNARTAYFPFESPYVSKDFIKIEIGTYIKILEVNQSVPD